MIFASIRVLLFVYCSRMNQIYPALVALQIVIYHVLVSMYCDSLGW